jgi:PIN domain nuclease of toxin-antitoxin system
VRRLLLDTQILVWLPTNDYRLPKDISQLLANPNNIIMVSGVIAFEYGDLQKRGRLPLRESFDELADSIDFELVDFPAEAWAIAPQLPHIHGDPVDRMLVAHALVSDATILTADANIRRYPVKTIF